MTTSRRACPGGDKPRRSLPLNLVSICQHFSGVIPYAQTIPPRLTRPCDHQWPVVEANRLIWFWHHPQGQPPMWESEHFPEATDPEWTDYAIHEWRTKTTYQLLLDGFRFATLDTGRRLQVALGVKRKWKKCQDS